MVLPYFVQDHAPATEENGSAQCAVDVGVRDVHAAVAEEAFEDERRLSESGIGNGVYSGSEDAGEYVREEAGDIATVCILRL